MKKMISLLALLLALSVFTCITAAAAQQSPAIPGDDSSTVDALSVPRIDIMTESGNGAELQKADGYVDAQITITDTDNSELSGNISFKVRGNSTAMEGIKKKGFNFKFAKKTEVLGMGKGKKWSLLANCFDPTLLRNYIIFELANELGLPYTSSQRIVELWLDGNYHGCYTLYEPVQEGKDRVDIDIESNDGKKDFLLELESSRVEEGVTYLTVGGIRFAISEPEEPEDDQFEYISGVMTDIVNTLKTGDEVQIREKIDVDSFAAYYLLNEYAKTLDFGFSSVFFFYQDGKLYAGPPWDYDLALGNANGDLGPKPKACSTTDGIVQSDKSFYQWLCRNNWFQDEIKSIYLQHHDFFTAISSDGGLLDTLRTQYADVFARNFTKWNVGKWWLNYQKVPYKTYEENFAYLKSWCYDRNIWLAEYFGPEPVKERLLGDADSDGEITILDATCIQRILADYPVSAFDMDAACIVDSEVSILDATAIQRYLAGFDEPYPIGEPIASSAI